MIRELFKRAGSALADYVASDQVDRLARELTAALDSKLALIATVEDLRAKLAGLRSEHDRLRADLLSALGDLSETLGLASARDCDWAWAQERLREGKTVTHPALWPHDDSPDFPPRIRRIGVDPDVVYKLETACTRAHFAKLNFPGTVGWRVVEPPPSGDHA